MSERVRGSWSRRLEAARGPRYWERVALVAIDDARRHRGAELRATLARLTYCCEQCIAAPDVVEPGLFAELVEHFGRIAGSYGPVDGADVERALNGVIALQERRGQDTTRLWLAMARLRAKISLEDDVRRRALESALAAATVGSEMWAEAVLAMVWYLIDVSRYDRALDVVAELEHEHTMPPGPLARTFLCGYHVMSGVALVTSFRNPELARWHLTTACALDDGGSDLRIRRWLATAHHYRGRLAEVEADYGQALEHYVNGQALQDTCPEELQATAFLHLRMAEPLIALGAPDQARDHLDLAIRGFSDSAEHSTGRLQAQLGFATLSAAGGDPDAAVRVIEETRRQAAQIGFWRGELLCLGFQAALLIRSRRFGRLPRCLIDILRTMRGGELSRNGIGRMLVKLPTLLGVVIRRMNRRPGSGTAGGDGRCPCALHRPPAPAPTNA